jgi:hypothetical protein
MEFLRHGDEVGSEEELTEQWQAEEAEPQKPATLDEQAAEIASVLVEEAEPVGGQIRRAEMFRHFQD